MNGPVAARALELCAVRVGAVTSEAVGGEVDVVSSTGGCFRCKIAMPASVSSMLATATMTKRIIWQKGAGAAQSLHISLIRMQVAKKRLETGSLKVVSRNRLKGRSMAMPAVKQMTSPTVDIMAVS